MGAPRGPSGVDLFAFISIFILDRQRSGTSPHVKRTERHNVNRNLFFRNSSCLIGIELSRNPGDPSEQDRQPAKNLNGPQETHLRLVPSEDSSVKGRMIEAVQA